MWGQLTAALEAPPPIPTPPPQVAAAPPAVPADSPSWQGLQVGAPPTPVAAAPDGSFPAPEEDYTLTEQLQDLRMAAETGAARTLRK